MWHRRKRVRENVKRAREARKQSEARLARDEREVLVPLREIRAANHIQEIISELIQQKARQIGDS